MSSLKIDETTQLVLVVGYDGSEPAQRALTGAANCCGIVPAGWRSSMWRICREPWRSPPYAVAAVQDGMDTEEQQLATRVDETLAGTGLKWHFQRRNGEIAPSLLAAAEEQLDAEGPSTRRVGRRRIRPQNRPLPQLDTGARHPPGPVRGARRSVGADGSAPSTGVSGTAGIR